MVRANEGSHSFTCHPRLSTSGMNHTCLYSPAAEHHHTLVTLWYSFPVPLRLGGWVGLGGLVKCWGGLSAEDGHPSQY